MKSAVTILVGIASVVVIAAGGLWLWQQFSVADAANAVRAVAADRASLARECAEYVAALQRDAVTPLPEAEKKAATDGRIKCLDAGII
jgi:hypothetical protein